MKTKTMAKLYKRFAKELIDEEIYIIADQTAYYNYVKDIISIYTKLPNQNEISEKTVAKYFRERNADFHPATIAFVHELGHLWATRHLDLDDEFYCDVNDQLAALQAKQFFEQPPYEEMLNAYYKTGAEKLANEFLFRMVKEKPEVMAKYDAILSKLY